ncbi:putative acyl-activating enzyme 1, peroxisomal [Acorus calamus]|uniref:Acyl-activating enzyme 1, peroxisomal n=1 Tax=Acorus calamus TaxID=4465 RepID=A0AAV9C923_ACOCL|nr:putative acyl-activating enzyme 1, peroxisomal [Acorus calamus]
MLEAAVVGQPDDYWGETPCAFVKLKDNCDGSADEIIRFCRDRLPRYMSPRTVVRSPPSPSVSRAGGDKKTNHLRRWWWSSHRSLIARGGGSGWWR